MAHNEPAATLPAVRGTSGLPHEDLIEGFAAAQQPGVRLLVRAADGLESCLAASLGAWKEDGSVVLVHPDLEVTEHLLENERVSRS